MNVLLRIFRHDYGEVAVVKVGAMNVSSIQYADVDTKAWAQGDDLAYFEFGSTVVCCLCRPIPSNRSLI